MLRTEMNDLTLDEANTLMEFCNNHINIAKVELAIAESMLNEPVHETHYIVRLISDHNNGRCGRTRYMNATGLFCASLLDCLTIAGSKCYKFEQNNRHLFVEHEFYPLTLELRTVIMRNKIVLVKVAGDMELLAAHIENLAKSEIVNNVMSDRVAVKYSLDTVLVKEKLMDDVSTSDIVDCKFECGEHAGQRTGEIIMVGAGGTSSLAKVIGTCHRLGKANTLIQANYGNHFDERQSPKHEASLDTRLINEKAIHAGHKFITANTIIHTPLSTNPMYSKHEASLDTRVMRDNDDPIFDTKSLPDNWPIRD